MALTNHFFKTLSREEFACLSVFLNELSKSMFATALFRDLCDKDRGKKDRKDKDEWDEDK